MPKVRVRFQVPSAKDKGDFEEDPAGFSFRLEPGPSALRELKEALASRINEAGSGRVRPALQANEIDLVALNGRRVDDAAHIEEQLDGGNGDGGKPELKVFVRRQGWTNLYSDGLLDAPTRAHIIDSHTSEVTYIVGISEILDNAIEAAFSSPTAVDRSIHVRLNRKNRSLEFFDNGVGMNMEQMRAARELGTSRRATYDYKAPPSQDFLNGRIGKYGIGKMAAFAFGEGGKGATITISSKTQESLEVVETVQDQKLIEEVDRLVFKLTSRPPTEIEAESFGSHWTLLRIDNVSKHFFDTWKARRTEFLSKLAEKYAFYIHGPGLLPDKARASMGLEQVNPANNMHINIDGQELSELGPADNCVVALCEAAKDKDNHAQVYTEDLRLGNKAEGAKARLVLFYFPCIAGIERVPAFTPLGARAVKEAPSTSLTASTAALSQAVQPSPPSSSSSSSSAAAAGAANDDDRIVLDLTDESEENSLLIGARGLLHVFFQGLLLHNEQLDPRPCA